VLSGLYISLESLAPWQLLRPETSWIGIGVTIAVFVVMPLLSSAKRRAGKTARNAALAADAVQSATCASLAGITLAGLVLNAVLHIQWIDSVAALAAVPLICVEGNCPSSQPSSMWPAIKN
jgi:divalent metal cation (Fe/Co/Zn/Cd) transporter